MEKNQSYIDKIEGLFKSDKRLAIPEYQRKFCWNSSKIENFYMNIFEAFNEDDSVFLGSFILQKENDYKNIVDGQQRICSLALLLIFIRVHSNRKISSLEDFIFYPSSGKSSEKILLVNFDSSQANQDFAKFFKETSYLNVGNYDGFAKSLNTLKAADKLLGKSVESAFSYFRDSIPSSSCEKFYTFLRDKLFANIINEDDNSKALSIFEILNTQGEPLTAFEVLFPRIEFLIKQFKVSSKDLSDWEDVKQNYPSIPISERESVSSAIVLSYLMLYRNKSSLGPSKQKEELYRTLRDINEKSKLLKFLKELKGVSDFYFNVWHVKDFNEESLSLKLDDFEKSCLEFLVGIKHTIVIPILCYYYSSLRKNFPDAIKATACFSALWRADALGGTNSIDQKYREAISSRSYKSLGDMKKFFKRCLKEEGVAKKDLLTKVSNDNLKAIGLSKFLLICATKSKVYRQGAWVVPSRLPKRGGVYAVKYKNMTIEHICPKSLADKSYDPEIINSKKVDSLGNYTLLPSVFNSSISNSSFPKKIHFYKKLVDAKQVEEKYLKNKSKKIKEEINDKAHYYLSDVASSKKKEWDLKDVDRRAKEIISSAYDTIMQNL